MSGLNNVLRARIARYGRLHRTGAILRGNPGCHAFRRLDRNREGRTVGTLVVTRHRRQAKLTGTRLGDRQANQATRVRNHEIDGFRRDMLGGEHQIAFVFPIFFIDQNNHAPGAHLGDDFLNRSDRGGFACRRHYTPSTSGFSMRST